MAQTARTFREILEAGRSAYTAFYESLTSPSVSDLLGEDDRETLASLPKPHPALPIRVLASLGHQARAGILEFHYTLRGSSPMLRDWLDANGGRLQELVPEAFGSSVLWKGWQPPPPPSARSDAVRVEWSELELAAADFARIRPAGVTSVVYVFVRDYAFRLMALYRTLDIDLVLDQMLERIRAGDDPPSSALATFKAREIEVREQSHGEFSTVWSIAVALALADGPLAPYALVDDRYAALPQDRERSSSASGEAQATELPAYRPSTAITSDVATANDSLQYDLYADAIARFISDDRTSPPLTIGIKAPWGAGKTSLMKMVQRKLEPDLPVSHGDPSTTRLSNEDVLRNTRLPPDQASAKFAVKPLDGGVGRATVWFNAWKYQSSEQLWAGLGHAIISQVQGRMTFAERERFWASLNVRRVDGGEVRRRIYAGFTERIVGYVVALPFLIIALAFIALWLPVAGAVAAGTSAVGVLGDGWRRWKVFSKEDAGASNPALVRDPGYHGQLGFMHLVHEDLKRVLALVASPKRPLVVFVDDLDRCAYTTVAQVVEALNTFLAGDFENCVFVIAMEPDLVAAQIHVAYEKLFDYLSARDGKRAGDLGWRFLEKMVQLPLALPPPGELQLKTFVGSLIDGQAGSASKPNQDDQNLEAARRQIAEARGGDTSLAGVESALREVRRRVTQPNEEHVSRVDELTLQRAAREAYADGFDDKRPEVRNLIERHAADLDRNPREIKRFLNVLRFYAYVAFWRQTAGIEAPDLAGAAKLAVLAVRCPNLLSWLGSEGRIASLEEAAHDAELWADELAVAPEYVQSELQRSSQLRTILGREPRVADKAVGFL